MTGQRRRHVVAQAHPLLVVVLHREHAGVRAIRIRQKLAERLGVLECGRLQRIVPVALEHHAQLVQHLALTGDFGAAVVAKTTRQTRLGALVFGSFGH